MKKIILCLILFSINALVLLGNQLFIKYDLDHLQEAITLTIESEMDKLSILAIINLVTFIIALFWNRK